MTQDKSRNLHETNPQEIDDRQISRRDFMQGSAAALGAAIASQAGMFAGTRHAEAKSIAAILDATEQDLFYRDRLPDMQTPFTNNSDNPLSLFDWNFPALINDASVNPGQFGGQGQPAAFSDFTEIPTGYNDMPVAIIGAGGAGLAAGYELMKLGLRPHFYEMQTANDTNGTVYARPYGRMYSWDWGGQNLYNDGAGAGWWPDSSTNLTTGAVEPSYSSNVHRWGRRVAELGGMRFPATHLIVRTYARVFHNDYYYGGDNNPDFYVNPWVPFRDPGLYQTVNAPDNDRGGVVEPNDNDTVVFDTVYNTKGIFVDRQSANPPSPGVYSETDRVSAGTTLAASNQAIYNLSFIYFDLLYGPNGDLAQILKRYSDYTDNPTQANADQIAAEWENLIERFDKMSLRERLIDAGWDDEPAYDDWGDYNISLSEMFGEIGTGTGPFAMFYYSSYMELLRIALQAADSNQDYFLGGPCYLMQPFLTHFTDTKAYGNTCLWNLTRNQVVTDKVIAVENASQGIDITTADGTTRTYTAAVVTAAPSAMRSTNLFPDTSGLIPSRAVSFLKRIRINNNSKIGLNFPNINNDPDSQAFWMDRNGSDDQNPNNDSVVTTLTDKTIRQIYTFDNYHWATTYNDTRIGGFDKQGTLLINYGWDYNAQSWTALDNDTAVRYAWQQMKEIYGFDDSIDSHLNWALSHQQTAVIVWEKVDGFNAAWRMAQPGAELAYGDDSNDADPLALLSEFQTAQVFGMTSYNHEVDGYTGLFLAGEATASPGLSGWLEGSIQTGLQAVSGIVKFLNEELPTKLTPTISSGSSFALSAHPGFQQLPPAS